MMAFMFGLKSSIPKFLKCFTPNIQPVVFGTRLIMPPEIKEVEFPEKRLLKHCPKVPILPANVKVKKHTRKSRDTRGPELVHNRLLHKQFGIMAIVGGDMRYEHFEAVRQTVNRHLDERNMFAIWRVDPPWKSRTKKRIGEKMGGGRGSIHHYLTPVKAGRIIIEMGGTVELYAVYPILKQVVAKLPFRSEIVTEEIIQEAVREKEEWEARNENPYTFAYLIENRMMGCSKWITHYDLLWKGKFR